VTVDVITIISMSLKIISALVGWLHDRKEFTSGEDAAISKAAIAVLNQTAQGKRIMENIRSMSDPDLDALLVSLEK
jgi:hypothetical protein